MQFARQHIAAHHGSERDHDLYLIVIDTAQQMKGDVTDQQTIQQTATSFVHQQAQTFVEGRRFADEQHAHQDGKNHHTHTIIEERLARDHELQIFGNAR